uniref:Carbohydrate ABC transporter ATP-binding protein, CUT1 family n=1 Tax=Chelativorans sp. (strain BNC1) TaxID=266779 RepID=Q11FY5_CHESB
MDVVYSGVSKNFGQVTALDNLNLSIKAGEFVSLLGPSGSGKTTSLNMLAGLTSISSGEIRIGGRRINEVSPEKRGISMVFQNYALYPHMTVEENLAFPLKARREIAKDEMDRRVRETASLLGVSDLLDRFPRELSGGQQQRVALGRALIRNPGVLLLDEPLSNLDARLRIRMRRDIKELHERLASTIVYVTHDQAEALTLSSRIAVFNKGRLQQFGSPEDIYERPVNRFVANFLGEREVTFIDGQLTEERGTCWFEAPDIRVEVTHPQSARKEVTLGLRVEALRPVRSGEGILSGEVRDVELSGPDLILYVRLGDQQEVVARAESSAGIRRGDKVDLGRSQNKFHLFDTKTGLALSS